MMWQSIETYLLLAAVLLILSVVASKFSDRLGIPTLIIFLVIGMLAGSDGPGGIYFDDARLAQNLGIIALVIILFSGGLDTSWKRTRTVMKDGLILATAGVLITALCLGVFAHFLLGISLLEGFLLGSIVSSTDAAAVFSVLRSKGVQLKGRLKPLLEFESGSNDPMAVFLTVAVSLVLTDPERTLWGLIPMFFQQMILGALLGVAAGKLVVYLTNRLRLGYSGLYPVLTLGMLFLTYSVTALIGGSGFLAVYLVGLMMSREEFLHKRSLLRFYDGLAWLMQIVMFLALGLLVFPSRLVTIVLPGLAVALFLTLVARPLSVFLTTIFSKISLPEKVFISWVGLCGAVPIILATYPRLMGIPQSDLIFNTVFFVVLISALLQGTTIPYVAKKLKLDGIDQAETRYPIEFVEESEWKGELQEIIIPENSWAVNKAIVEIGLPGEYLVVLISRGQEFIIPNGSVVLLPGDKILGLAEGLVHQDVVRLLTLKAEPKPVPKL
ncbi:MAG TPA: potassium/proton antiporter [Anaerolineaceae bacterium]|nr:potassium/proton antiporter [Anaerolineaceae bacterium]